jgi:prepilin peptidase CpaA
MKPANSMEDLMDILLLTVPLVLSAIILVPAVVSDLLYRRIPNILCLTGLLAGIFFHGVTAGITGFSMSLLAGVMLMGATFSFFATGWLGAGDVKLLAAAGAIGGSPGTAFDILLAVVSIGAIAAFASLIWRDRLRDFSARLASSSVLQMINKNFILSSTPVRSEAKGFPYALAIAGGTFLVLALNAAGISRGSLLL